jgi:ABC-type tungstate transport system permease subunit
MEARSWPSVAECGGARQCTLADDKEGSAFPTAAGVELESVACGTGTMFALGDSGTTQLLMAVR